MLTDVMDLDPRITSDGNGYGSGYGVHCNFHYGHVYDVYDEHAKNEAACVQALRHLIAKADSEIDDLKDKLAILQCQRKWDESNDHENLFEVCCAAFKRRIDSLTSTIQRLRDGKETVSEIHSPVERISNIINPLIKSNFTKLDEQEGDLPNKTELVVGSGSQNFDTDVREQATTLEFSPKHDKQSPVLERLDKDEQLTHTVSEESFTDAASYSIKDLTETGNMGSLTTEASEQIENAEDAPVEKCGFSTSVEPVPCHSPFQVSNEGNTNRTAPQCGNIESCIGGSKTDESKSLVVAVNTGVMIKVDKDSHEDAITHHDSADVFSKTQTKNSIEPHLEDLKNQDLVVSDYEITYGRKKSRLTGTLKQSEQKVQQKPVTKRKLSSIENFGQSESGSPSSTLERSLILVPEENAAAEYPFKDSLAKKHQSKGKKRDVLGMKGKDSGITSSGNPITPESLKERLSVEPDFLKKLNVAQLKDIVKLLGLRSLSKKKKDEVIMALKEHLATL